MLNVPIFPLYEKAKFEETYSPLIRRKVNEARLQSQRSHLQAIFRVLATELINGEIKLKPFFNHPFNSHSQKGDDFLAREPHSMTIGRVGGLHILRFNFR